MIETTVKYLGGVQFEAAARGHKVISDQPPDNQGQDAGMTPPELLLSALATCVGFYAVQYLRARKLPADGLGVRVTADKAASPARLYAFRVEITVPGLEDERHRKGVLRAAKSCLIHNTLERTPGIEIVLNASTAAAG
ncbi:MAG: OsmC family protein [Bryobacteraceae bacterium]